MNQPSWRFGPLEASDELGKLEQLIHARSVSAGQVLSGRLRIEEQIGRGGMGTVFRARDLELGRDVAIKIMINPLDERGRQRFVREGQVMAGLVHPGILAIHGGGLTSDGVPYMVLEYVEGARTLEQVFREATRSERMQLLIKVAQAVGFAHAAGVVHRDLKPDNILVTQDGRPKVCDFGLGWHAAADRLTHSGLLIGTPLFLPPEHAGVRSSVDPLPQSDVWSLGVILYYALTETYPFLGPNMLAVIARAAHQDPTPILELDPTVPPALVHVAKQALAKSPHDRFANGAEFAAALAHACQPTPRPAPGRIAVVGLFVTVTVLLGLVAAGRWTPEPKRASPEPSPVTPSQLVKRPVASSRPPTTPTLPQHPEPLHRFEHEGQRNVRPRFVGRTLWTVSSTLACAWDLTMGRLRKRVELPGGVHDLAHAGDRLVALGRGTLYEITPEGLTPHRLVGEPVFRIFASTPPEWLLVRRGRVERWPTPMTPIPLSTRFAAAAISHDGAVIAIADGVGERAETVFKGTNLVLLDAKTGTERIRCELTMAVDSLALSPKGDQLLVGTRLGQAFLLDTESGKVVGSLRRAQVSALQSDRLTRGLAHPRRVTSVAISPDGTCLVTCSRGRRQGPTDPNEFAVWDAKTLALRRVQKLATIRPHAIALAPDGRLLVVGGSDGKVEVWPLPGS